MKILPSSRTFTEPASAARARTARDETVRRLREFACALLR